MALNAYIDESGDRGWQPRQWPAPGQRSGSSRIFSMTAVIIPSGSEGQILPVWEAAARALGRRPGDVMHWQAVRQHEQRRYLVDQIASLPALQTISVVLCKQHLANAAAIRDPGYLYNWTFRLMIERLSWLGQRSGQTVTATFAQVSGLVTARLRLYVNRLRTETNFIEWTHLGTPGIDTPANRRMLQIADCTSGAVYAAFEPGDLQYTEQSYLTAIKPCIWRRPGRPLWKDGLKYGPWPSADCKNEHPWFEAFCA
jgi:hypothetical protein